ncbi:hypothetical protein NESM_000823500 [Novymonas esmeraldas]|uniref:Uncharacterized protein n=1 Tax=Novymonas esmeraldas TaxID=1808958 RepID=A0AAW0EZ77_9TRYP
MDPVRPAQRLERPPPPRSPERRNYGGDEDEEDDDESGVSTTQDSESLSQHFRAFAWPFAALGPSPGVSPTASMRRGVSPLASDQRTCVSGSSLTAWSGANVVCNYSHHHHNNVNANANGGGGSGGSGGALVSSGWAKDRGLETFDKLRATPRSAGAVASRTTLSPSTKPGQRPGSTTAAITTATTTDAAAVPKSGAVAGRAGGCELTAENLDRLRDAQSRAGGVPVAQWTAIAQATAVPSPPCVDLERVHTNNRATPVTGVATRVSRAAALSKQQPLPARRPRGVDPPRPAADAATTSPSSAVTKEQGVGATTATAASPSSSPRGALARPDDGHEGPLSPPAEVEERHRRNGGPSGPATAAAAVTAHASPLTVEAPSAAPTAAPSTTATSSTRATAKRLRRESARTRYQGQVLPLEACTETAADESDSSPNRDRAPPLTTWPGTATTPSAGTHVSLPRGARATPAAAAIEHPVGGDAAQAARRRSAAAHSGTLPPSAYAAGPGTTVGDAAAAAEAAATTSPNTAPTPATPTQPTASPGVAAPPLLPVYSAPPAERGWSGTPGATAADAVPTRSAAGPPSTPSTPRIAAQGAAPLRTSSSAATSSRPPLLSNTAIGAPSAVLEAALTAAGEPAHTAPTSSGPPTHLSTKATPHTVQQQVRPAVIISRTGAIEAAAAAAAAPRKLQTVVTVTAPPVTSDPLASGETPTLRRESSRHSCTSTTTSKRSVSHDAYVPFALEGLPSTASTQPPGSQVRTPTGGGGGGGGGGAQRGHLAMSSRTSSVTASSERRARPGGHADSASSSVSSQSVPFSTSEVGPPAPAPPAPATVCSSVTAPSSNGGSTSPPASLSMDGRAGGARPHSDVLRCVAPAINHTAAAAVASVAIPAAPPSALTATRTPRGTSAEKHVAQASSSAAEAASVAAAPRGEGHDGGASPVQAATRLRRTPVPGRLPHNNTGGRLPLRDLRTTQPPPPPLSLPQHLHTASGDSTAAAATTSEERGGAKLTTSDRPRALAPLDAGAAATPHVTEAGAASASPLNSGTGSGGRGRETVLKERRATAAVLPSTDGAGGDGTGTPAAARALPGRIRPRSHSLPAGALVNATAAVTSTTAAGAGAGAGGGGGGGVAGPPHLTSSAASPSADGVRRDLTRGTAQPQSQPHRPSAAPQRSNLGGGAAVTERPQRLLHSPPIRQCNHFGSPHYHSDRMYIAPAAAGGGQAPGLLLPPSTRATSGPGGAGERGAEPRPTRLPSLQPSLTPTAPNTTTAAAAAAAANNMGWLNSPNEAGALSVRSGGGGGGGGDNARVSAARRKTVSVIRDCSSARSRSSTSANGSCSSLPGDHNTSEDRRLSARGRLVTLQSPEDAGENGTDDSQERSGRSQTRKVPPIHRRRSTDMCLPEEDGAGEHHG